MAVKKELQINKPTTAAVKNKKNTLKLQCVGEIKILLSAVFFG